MRRATARAVRRVAVRCVELALGAAVLACAAPPRADAPARALDAGIDSLNARLVRAYRDRDPGAYAALFTDTAVFEWPAVPTVRGTAGLAAMALFRAHDL